MVLAEDLRQAVLQAALQGKLTEQLETDSNVDEMLISIQEKKKRLIANKKIKKEKQLPEIQDEDIPFEIPDSWRWVRMQSLLNICSAVRVHQSDWKETGIPFFRAREIVSLDRDGYVNNDLFITEELYKKIKEGSGVPASNDLMVSGVGTLGKVYIVRENDKFYYKDASVLCFENIGNQNSEYIKYALKSPIMVKQIHKDAMGTTVATLTIDRANAMLIPIPPIEEQQRIVDKIKKIMLKIDEYANIEKELESLKKEFPTNMKDVLLQAAMQGKLTEQLESDSSVDELLASIQKEKKQLIKEKKIYKDKKLVESVENKFDIDIPNNWRFVNLQEICTKITDGEHKTPNRVSEYQGYYLLSARNILNGKLVLDDVDYVSKEEYDVISKRCNPRRNDILISCSGSVGRCCLISDDNNYVMVRSAAMIHCLQMNNKYIMYAIQSPYMQAQIDELKKQSVQANLFQSAIASLLISIPPIEEQQRIVERLDVLLPLCEELREM